MILVAAYCRVSTDKDDQANSYEAQQRYFREFIERNPDWSLYQIYADEGISGTSTRKRTQFNRMIADAYDGKFTLILTKEISRFTRNILDTITYTRDLKQIGVGVYFFTENLNTLNPESEMMLTFMGTLAQEESRRTSARVKWGQSRQMEQGVVFGHSLLGYDVQGGKMTINEVEAELVQLIFRKYVIERKGTSTIARELRDAGYRTKTGNPQWRANHIIKILHNEKYVGDLIQKKSYTPDYLTHTKKTNHGQEDLITLRDHHPPIIPREIWDAAQAELSRRDKHSGEGHSNRYLFSGKIKCGMCGASFVGRQKARRDGSKSRRWCCGTAAAEGAASCSIGKLVRDDDARQMLKTALQNLEIDRDGIADDVLLIAMKAIRAGEVGGNYDPDRLKWQLASIKEKKEACLDCYFAGDITKEEMENLKSKYDARIMELEKQIQIPPSSSEPDANKIRNAIDRLLKCETKNDVFYGTILDKLTVYKDRHLELHLKYLPQCFLYKE